MAHPQSGYSSTDSRSNWNLECWFLWTEENRSFGIGVLEFGVLVFVDGGKFREPGDKRSEQGREPTTNSTQI